LLPGGAGFFVCFYVYLEKEHLFFG